MFARQWNDERDAIPLWTWFLILPGLVLVTVLVIRRLRYQARVNQTQPAIDQEFRLESSRQMPQPAESRRFAGVVEYSPEMSRQSEQPAGAAEASDASMAQETFAAESADQSTGDDLKIIEGIGPKIEVILKNAGILTFRQLASTSVERLYQILHEANLRLADPGTWPEQARLAANENWDFLKALQDRTKAGRRSIEE